MLKKFIKIIKKIVFSSFLLYGYNLLAVPLNIIIPINIVNVAFISFCGIPALFSLILIHIIVF
jgi:hypothetical protein